MSIEAKFLRQVSQIAYNSRTNAGAVAVGNAVPAGVRRIIYRVILSNTSTTLADVSLHRDGATAAAGQTLDRFNVTSSATPTGVVVLGKNIRTPLYTLESGETFGLRIQAGATTIHVTILYYDDLA